MSGLEFFFYPKSVAIIGASKNKSKGGNIILNNVKKGFDGEIYPVNPKYKEIEGLRCYDISNLPYGIDVDIIFVPAQGVVQIIEELSKKGVKGVIVESGGFAESGVKGDELQNRLLKIKQRTGIRIWGPNCMGLVDMHTGYVFSFVSHQIWDFMHPGDISLIVQSGMLSAGFLIDRCSTGIFGISKACSIGNKLDVDECDLLEFLLQDKNTKVIAMYLESIKDGRRFLRLVKESNKPIVVLKGGRTREGAKAALTHTASAAGSYEIISGIFSQSNIVEGYDFNHMMDLCLGLSSLDEYKVTGNRVGVVTYSGGAGIISVDLMKDTCLKIAHLKDSTKQKIKAYTPQWLPISNPADVWPAVEKNGIKAYKDIFKCICEDSGVDIVFLHVFSHGRLGELDLKEIKDTSLKNNKPVFLWVTGTTESKHEFYRRCREVKFPVFSEISRAVEVMDKSISYNQKKRQIHNMKTDIIISSTKASFGFPKRYGVLDEYESKLILSKWGIPTVEEYVVPKIEDAFIKAEKMGYPVVLKGILPGVIHKSEHHLVAKDIYTKDGLEYAYGDILNKVGDKGYLLLQKQVDNKLELIIGLVRDENYGPVIMCGFGGMLADLLEDKIFRLAPFLEHEAYLYTFDLKNQKLLDGYRNYPKVNRKDLARILKMLGDKGEYFVNIESVDINPLVVTEDGLVCVDATIVLTNETHKESKG